MIGCCSINIESHHTALTLFSRLAGCPPHENFPYWVCHVIIHAANLTEPDIHFKTQSAYITILSFETATWRALSNSRTTLLPTSSLIAIGLAIDGME